MEAPGPWSASAPCLYNGDMEQIILNILEALRRGETVDDKALVKLIHAEARREGADKRDLAKRPSAAVLPAG